MGHGAGSDLAMTSRLAPPQSRLCSPAPPKGGANAKYKSAQLAHQTSVIPRPVLKLGVGIRSPYTEIGIQSVPRGNGLPRRSSLAPRNDRSVESSAPIQTMPRSAAPLRGSPQCAHWGKGSPEYRPWPEGKDRTQYRHFFSRLAVSLPRRPLRRCAPAPLKGAPRA